MKPIVIYDDNQNDIFLLENLAFHAHTKPIEIHHQLVWNKIEKVSLGWCIATSVFLLTNFCNLVKKKEGLKITKGFHFFGEKMGLSRHIMKKKFLNSLYLRNMF
jgi:hypothetical protein